MSTFRKILSALFISVFIISVSPQPSYGFGIPSIDVQGLVQAVKRAITDVQNSSQLAWATKAAKNVQGALGKFNEAMNGFIKNNILARVEDLKKAKEKYEKKWEAAKNNKWVKKGMEVVDKVKEGVELAKRGKALLDEAEAIKKQADQ